MNDLYNHRYKMDVKYEELILSITSDCKYIKNNICTSSAGKRHLVDSTLEEINFEDDDDLLDNLAIENGTIKSYESTCKKIKVDSYNDDSGVVSEVVSEGEEGKINLSDFITVDEVGEVDVLGFFE